MDGNLNSNTTWQQDWRGLSLVGIGLFGLMIFCLAQFDHATIQTVIFTTLAGVFVVAGSLMGLILVQSALPEHQFADLESDDETRTSFSQRTNQSASTVPKVEDEVDPFVEILRRQRSQNKAA